MVHEIKEPKLSSRFSGLLSSRLLIPLILLIAVLISVPIISFLSSKPQDIRQRAAVSGPTATMELTPNTGNVVNGQPFTVDLVIDGGGQTFNAAQATVAVSSNLTIQAVTITPTGSGGCNFVYANQASTPTIAHPSFAGAILTSSSSRCTVFTMTLVPNTNGNGAVTLTNTQVKSDQDHSEILLSSQNGSFTISSTPTQPIPQSVLMFSPVTSTVNVGQTFSVQLRVNTNGQTINALQTEVSYPANLLSVTSVTGGSSFAIEVPTPTGAVPSGILPVAYGSITPRSGDLLVTTITFTAISAGTANVNLINASVISDVSNTDVLKNTVDGVYTINQVGSTPTPTVPPPPTATTAPSATPTTPPAPTATPTPFPPTATPTPLPPTPTGALTGLTVNTQASDTYNSSASLTGAKTSLITSVFVNNSTTGVSMPTATSWQSTVSLTIGTNTFSIFGRNASGGQTATLVSTIKRHKSGDINGDGVVDLTDLSIFGSDWQKTSGLNNSLSDMNDDANVNLTDFSILASAYGN